MSEEVVAIKLTREQIKRLDAIIGEVRGFGSGWRVLDEIAVAVYDGLPETAVQ